MITCTETAAETSALLVWLREFKFKFKAIRGRRSFVCGLTTIEFVHWMDFGLLYFEGLVLMVYYFID